MVTPGKTASEKDELGRCLPLSLWQPINSGLCRWPAWSGCTVSVQLPTDDPEASPNPARSAPNRRVILSVQTRRFRRWPLLNLAVTVC